jgi:hypothetical protein
MNRFTEKQLEAADIRLDEIRDAKVEKEQKLRVPTPRTDEEWAAWPYAGPGISVHFGRELERELAAARAEIATVTEQRDRLAEALRNCLPFITGDGCGEYSDARKALQSLTTNEL